MKNILFQAKKQLAIFMILLVISTITSTLFHFVMAEFLNVAVSGDVEILVQTFLFSLVFLALMLLLEYCFNKIKKTILCNCNVELRNNIVSNIFRKGIGEFEQKNSAVYLNCLLSDCDMLEELYFSNTLKMMQVIMELFVASIAVILVSPFMFFVMIVLTFMTILFVNIGNEKIEYGMKEFAKSREDYSVFLKEQFEGYRLIRMFRIKDKVMALHAKSCQEMEEKKYSQQLFVLQKNYLSEFIGFASTLAVMAIAAYLALKGEVSAGFVLAAGQLVGKITYPIMTFPEVMMNYRSAKPIIKRLDEYSSEETGRKIGIEVEEINKFSLQDVTFSYPEMERKVLSKINFQFEAGKKYLIVGESGSGKTTLLQFVANFFSEYQGKAYINNELLSDCEEESIYRKLGFMTQNVLLFEDTLRNNLALYGNFTDIKIINALKEAGISNFEEIFADGLDTVIKENGHNFSGGEKQRIALARVLLHGFSWLLFDEFTANLDIEKALHIEKQLLKLESKTVITVSHRLNKQIAEKYDEILVLEKGRIVEHGSYEQLIKNKKFFLQLQF